MAEQPFISVIIPVWNSPELIAKCLSAISAQTYPRDRYEILVIDNGSTDDTAEVVRSFSFVTLLSEPIAGSYRARNLGLKFARGEYVAFTDADCVPDAQWLAAAAQAASRYPHVGVLAGHVDLFRVESGGSKACVKYERAFGFDQAKNASRSVCVTANWMSRRDTLFDFGGFDDNVKSGGDWKLCRRIGAAGYAIVYVPEMRVGHPARGSLAKLMSKRRRTIGGRWRSTERRWRFWRCSRALVRDSVVRMLTTAFDRRLSVVDRVAVISVDVALSTAAMFELVRLACGGEPRRA